MDKQVCQKRSETGTNIGSAEEDKISQQQASQRMGVSRQVSRLASITSMIGAGYWKPRRGSTVCAHPMRKCSARFGESIQIDGGSPDWLEGAASIAPC